MDGPERERRPPAKDTVTVTAYRDGPLIIRGPIEVTGHDAFSIVRDGRAVALCRCGKSRLKPFCDGTHKVIGFRAPGAGETVVPELD